MAAGRPRTTSLQPDEMIALGEEMLLWVELNDPIHLKQWYSIHKGFLYNEWKAMIQIPQFLPYYEQALALVSLKYITKDSPIDSSIKHRWIRLYFKDVKEEEDETAKFTSDLKVAEAAKVSEEDAKRSSDVLSQLKLMQENHLLSISHTNNNPAQ